MKKLTDEDVDQRLIGRNIKRLDNYLGKEIKIRFQCLIENCNYIWQTRPDDIFTGHGCPKCVNLIKLTNEIVDQRLQHRNITRLDDISNNKTKIHFQCCICNYIWKTSPDAVLNKNKTGCAKCSKCLKLTNEVIDQKLQNRNIIRLDDYVSCLTQTNFQCTICNCVWTTTANSVLNTNKTGCPNCSACKNEKLVGSILKRNNIVVETHKQISKIIDGENRRMFVDFYIESANTIIEYNGRQHYEPIQFNKMNAKIAEDNFIKQQERDLYLQQFCDLNKICLIWIDGRKYTNLKLERYAIDQIIPIITDRNI